MVRRPFWNLSGMGLTQRDVGEWCRRIRLSMREKFLVANAD